MIGTPNRAPKRFLAPAVVTIALFLGLGTTACSSTKTVTVNGHELKDLGDGHLEGKDGVIYEPDGTAFKRYSNLGGEVFITQYVCSETDKKMP